MGLQLDSISGCPESGSFFNKLWWMYGFVLALEFGDCGSSEQNLCAPAEFLVVMCLTAQRLGMTHVRKPAPLSFTSPNWTFRGCDIRLHVHMCTPKSVFMFRTVAVLSISISISASICIYICSDIYIQHMIFCFYGSCAISNVLCLTSDIPNLMSNIQYVVLAFNIQHLPSM